ncbi:hypothetical protein EB796_023953 [Bugula neritina]|uniref:Uncharacterized protein n=1 Tax=Bugula neritina TaxID=10212 RepID=A0A7J7IUZ8_BUGNE|nr:hypothetical protein EB796_023953 [Bugula neritina]
MASSVHLQLQELLESSLNLPMCHFINTEVKYKNENEDQHDKAVLCVTEYECKEYFGWSLSIVRDLLLHPTEHSPSSDDVDFDKFLSQANVVSSSRFLLTVKAEVLSVKSIPLKRVPDTFRQEINSMILPYLLVEVNIRTTVGRYITLYGDSLKHCPFLVGVVYCISNVEVTLSKPHIAWIGRLSQSHVVDIQNHIPGISNISEPADRKYVLMWNVLHTAKSSEVFLIKARILKLIKLEIFINMKKDSVEDESQDRKLSSKLVMSMDDSSCGFWVFATIMS